MKSAENSKSACASRFGDFTGMSQERFGNARNARYITWGGDHPPRRILGRAPLFVYRESWDSTL
jgi:hypothetical protein